MIIKVINTSFDTHDDYKNLLNKLMDLKCDTCTSLQVYVKHHILNQKHVYYMHRQA